MTITLFENFRAVFYAPFYAAHALGVYEKEGLDVVLSGGESPSVTATSLLSGEADVSWGGPMRILYTYETQPDCNLVAFCEVVTRDPFYLIGARPNPGFDLAELQNLRMATVSEVPTPWLCLQDDIRRAGLDPDQLTRQESNSMSENEAGLRNGEFDVIQVFEPYVSRLLDDGAGFVWRAAADRGPTSYTTFYTTRQALTDKRDELLSMTRAMYRTQKWLRSRTAAEIADAISSFFPDLPFEVLSAAIDRYKRLGIWGKNPRHAQIGFNRLDAALRSGGLISRGAAYTQCIDTTLADAIIKEDPPSA
ncbi:MAG: ABC transporter substrate-binding protein [Alphaproteobacteria bacterium]|nr:ABC transporter substrate-binding protein [Alphaproteobacteria bacterium]